MLLVIKKDYDAISKEGARIVAEQVCKKPDCVLGFASGSSPLGLYKELIRMHREEGLDFSKVTTFNLDEYVGLPPEHDQSYHYFMWENLFKHLNVHPRRIHVLHGMADDVEAHCAWYEEQIVKCGGIDLQILGIGGNGHIAFNEPGSSLDSRTRINILTEKTRQDNARFFDSIDQVPKYAITMGIGTIMDARKLIILANGKSKAPAIKVTIEGPISAMVPATIVQMHHHATVLVDEEAASQLSDEWREE
ncbi:MAG: glucosamine-6-phosphate deaminase [Fidelibacterota bacterium]|nr:MAG: glucosamine-6-phosphate deaminase [Candidatus Neomarinimicrobiota bacterium]